MKPLICFTFLFFSILVSCNQKAIVARNLNKLIYDDTLDYKAFSTLHFAIKHRDPQYSTARIKFKSSDTSFIINPPKWEKYDSLETERFLKITNVNEGKYYLHNSPEYVYYLLLKFRIKEVRSLSTNQTLVQTGNYYLLLFQDKFKAEKIIFKNFQIPIRRDRVVFYKFNDYLYYTKTIYED